MTIKTLLAAFIVAVVPALAQAQCSHGAEGASISCADGMAWDPEAMACVVRTSIGRPTRAANVPTRLSGAERSSSSIRPRSRRAVRMGASASSDSVKRDPISVITPT